MVLHYRRAAVVAVVLGAIATAVWAGGSTEPTITRVSPTGAVVIDAPIAAKRHYQYDDFGQWMFRFDLPDGGSYEVPVSKIHFDRFAEGDWVEMHCEPGALCTLTDPSP